MKRMNDYWWAIRWHRFTLSAHLRLVSRWVQVTTSPFIPTPNDCLSETLYSSVIGLRRVGNGSRRYCSEIPIVLKNQFPIISWMWMRRKSNKGNVTLTHKLIEIYCFYWINHLLLSYLLNKFRRPILIKKLTFQISLDTFSEERDWHGIIQMFHFSIRYFSLTHCFLFSPRWLTSNSDAFYLLSPSWILLRWHLNHLTLFFFFSFKKWGEVKEEVAWQLYDNKGFCIVNGGVFNSLN